MSSAVSKALGKAVRQQRERIGMSQEELGLESDVHRTYVSLIERGIRHPTVDIVFKLATALQLKPYQLIKAAEKHLD